MKNPTFDTLARASFAPNGPGTPGAALATRILRRFSAWRALRRERRELALLGPTARIELDAMLAARGLGGLSLRLWPPAQRAADTLACGESGPVRAAASAEAAAIRRSVCR
jgi:hypothetical protein